MCVYHTLITGVSLRQTNHQRFLLIDFQASLGNFILLCIFRRILPDSVSCMHYHAKVVFFVENCASQTEFFVSSLHQIRFFLQISVDRCRFKTFSQSEIVACFLVHTLDTAANIRGSCPKSWDMLWLFSVLSLLSLEIICIMSKTPMKEKIADN